MLTSTKMSICERGYREVRMAALNVCWRCMLISWDLRSPRGRRLRSPVLKVAMLYWQFTTTLSCNALPRPPVTCTHSVTGYFTDSDTSTPPYHVTPCPTHLSPAHIQWLVTSLTPHHVNCHVTPCPAHLSHAHIQLLVTSLTLHHHSVM